MAAIAAAVAASQRPDRPERPPKELQWPKCSDVYEGKGDMAEWLVTYRQLTIHVDPRYLVQHFLNHGMAKTIRQNVEGFAASQGMEANALTFDQICTYLASTYDRPDGTHRRVLAYLAIKQNKQRIPAYLRRRREARSLLMKEGIHLQWEVEKSLLLDSVKLSVLCKRVRIVLQL